MCIKSKHLSRPHPFKHRRSKGCCSLACGFAGRRRAAVLLLNRGSFRTSHMLLFNSPVIKLIVHFAMLIEAWDGALGFFVICCIAWPDLWRIWWDVHYWEDDQLSKTLSSFRYVSLCVEWKKSNIWPSNSSQIVGQKQLQLQTSKLTKLLLK